MAAKKATHRNPVSEDRLKVIIRTKAHRNSINICMVFEYAQSRHQSVYLFLATHVESVGVSVAS